MGIETLNEDLELNIPMFDDDMDIIAKLDDEPNAVGGLTAAELKAEFDRPGKTIQKYLNETLVPSLIGTVAEESVRAQNEYIRVTNENQRIINEEVREEAETAREQAEKEREKTIKLISDLTVSADTLPAGEKAQVEKTVENGAYSLKLKIPEGKSGRDGDPGPAGADGFTPKITANETTGGYNLLIQNKNDLEMITIKNGKDGNPGPAGKSGSDGAPGSDGVGIKSVVQTELSTEDQGRNTMRITKTDGTTTDFYVFNGRRGRTGPVGQPGKDGRNGNPGKSAYEYAKDGGFTGTEEAFAELLANGNGGGADWDQNDPEGAGYVKGRTHWYDEDGFHPLNGRFLPDSVPWVENYATDILSCEVLLDDNGEAKLDVRPEIFEGGEYVVSWNGAEFNCEARAFEENGAYIGMAIGSGDPFTIILVTEEMVETVGASFLVRGSLDYARTVVDLRISKRGIYYQKLQKELLPDDVPFVSATEQSLTEEQKAQARDNIGVENVLESVGGDTLTWDGNTEGLVSVLNVVYKVSDAVPAMDDFANGATACINGTNQEFYSGTDGIQFADGLIVIAGWAIVVVPQDLAGVDLAGFMFAEAGTYFMNDPGAVVCTSITIPGYTGFVKKQLKEEYIPESVPNIQTAAVGQTVVVSEVDENGKPTKWEARDVGSGGTTTQMVSTIVTVGTEPVVLDDTAPEQEVLLAWDAQEARTVPAFTNYYIPRGNISYPRTFNANAYTQFWAANNYHGNGDAWVSGHEYFQAIHYTMDGDSVCVLSAVYTSVNTIVPEGTTHNGAGYSLTGSGWFYSVQSPASKDAINFCFNPSGSGTGTIDYIYCIDVTALKESGVIESTSITYLADLFGGLELVPGQDFEGASFGNSMKLTITRGVKRIEVEGGTESTTLIGGDVLSTDVGNVTFILKVPKTVSTNGASGSGGCDWSGKKWVAFGDSLTDETINANKKYYRHIEGKTGINVVVMGAGGTGYAKNYGGGTSYGERMTVCPSDADVITIFGSINDWNSLNTGGVQIGSPSDSLDAGTYSGYVNNCIDVAIDKAPYAQIALVSPMFYRGIALNLQESIAAALKAVAEYRRIKFLDLYHDSGFRIENDTFAQAYTTDYSATDETFGHPNNLAHEQLIAPEFMELLRRMLLS